MNRSESPYGQRHPNQGYSSASSQGGGAMSGLTLRLLIGLGIVLFSIMSYYGNHQTNPITGKPERVAMSVKDEIQLGMNHRSQMGQMSRDPQASRHVAEIGNRLVYALQQSLASQQKDNPFRFEFHLLADRRMVNAFALPGGQIFITEGLYRQLKTEDQVAGVLAHEMGHVLERHGAKQMAKQGLIQGISGAASVLGGDANTSRTAAAIGNMVTMRYSREAEFEADNWAVDLARLARYNPAEMINVLEFLKNLSGGGGPPEFLSTHPSSDSRIENIRQRLASRESSLPQIEYEPPQRINRPDRPDPRGIDLEEFLRGWQ
jgi:predicted Zn-dependent protease